MSSSPDPQPANPPIAGIPSGTPIEIVGQFKDEEKEEVARQQNPPPYIAFEHVSKSFGDVHVLDDVSFSVQPGETLCILGRSGVGKSVSLQQIMGFLKPDAGRGAEGQGAKFVQGMLDERAASQAQQGLILPHAGAPAPREHEPLS